MKPRIEALNKSQQALAATEKELREQYKLIERITDTSPLGIIVADTDGNITFANKAAEDMLELIRDEKGNLIYDNPGSHLPFWKTMDIHENISDAKHEIKKIDGSNMLLSISSAPLNNDFGELEGMVATLTDVTESTHIQEELKKRLNYELATVKSMRLLLEPADLNEILPRILEIIHRSVGNSRTYVFQNEEDSELGLCMSQRYEVVADGITREIDNPLLKHLPYSKGGQKLLASLQSKRSYTRVVAELDGPEKTILADQGILSILILPIYCGQDLWGFIGFDDCESVRLWHEDDINLLWVVADGIGEAILRKRSEDEIRESEAKYRSLFNQSAEGIYLHDLRGNILDVNDEAVLQSGYSKEELLNLDVFSFLSKEVDREKMMRRWSQWSPGTTVSLETQHIRKNGSIYPAELTINLVNFGSKIMIMALVRDITERKKAEESLIKAKMMAEENSRIKSEFLANMSHELRTPLTAIIGFSDMLSSEMFGSLNEKQIRFSRHINTSGEHLLELINEILDLAKIEAGKMELECEKFPLSEVLDEMQTLIAPLAVRKKIDLEIENNIQETEIFADRMKFKQIMYNLLSNAIKFTPDNGKVLVIANKTDKGVCVSVSDSGIGIPENKIQNIFNPFTQVDSSSKRKHGGTGLGLALVRQFVEMHKGNIQVKSEKGKGSTFTFTIPDKCCSEK
ncbi:PAS domain S-box protein [Methanolobus sp. ZRKC2]|uniref:PAS domain S-box protein n=1 Tax=Methanolobus sp. ZRKC2 TaxID=3125783 RepID=UPI00324ACC74